MPLDITHGMYRAYTGSSQLRSGEEVVITTIQGPSDALGKTENFSAMAIETRFKHSTGSRPLENLVSALVTRLLSRYVVAEMYACRSIIVSICANTTDLALICNSVTVACLDGGIPLKRMFYCVGRDDLLVFEGGEVVLCHSRGLVGEERMREARAGLAYVKESIEYGIRDMYEFE